MADYENWQSQGARPRTQTSGLACRGRNKNIYPGRVTHGTNEREHTDWQSQGASPETQKFGLTRRGRRNKNVCPGRTADSKKNSQNHSVSVKGNDTELFYMNELSDGLSQGTRPKILTPGLACRGRNKNICPGRIRDTIKTGPKCVSLPSFLSYNRRNRTEGKSNIKHTPVLIVSEEELSRRVFRVLDCLGYSQDLIHCRREFYRGLAEEEADDEHTWILAGSKGEGLTSFRENDVDVLVLNKGIVVTHSLNPEFNIDGTTVLYLDDTMCGPGYFQLKVGIRCQQLESECLFKSNTGELYVSSSLFTDYCKSTIDDENFIGVSGPAMTRVHPELNIQVDIVYGFTCIYPDILYDWANRKRNHGWPSPEVIREVVAMEAQLVAKGDPCSDTQWKEWRICFIPGELKLVKNLNETQTKLYILLKFVKKQILHIDSDGISSYIMKNIVFWMAELFPVQSFTESTLISNLLKALKILRYSLKMNYLPYYMIPGRNLLAGRMTDLERQLMIVHVTELIKEGPWLVFRINKLSNALCCLSEDELDVYRSHRDEIELLCLNELENEVDGKLRLKSLLYTYDEQTILGESINGDMKTDPRFQTVLS